MLAFFSFKKGLTHFHYRKFTKRKIKMSIIPPLRDKWKGFDGCRKGGQAPLAGCAFHRCRSYLSHTQTTNGNRAHGAHGRGPGSQK